jgi:hypothetical protein
MHWFGASSLLVHVLESDAEADLVYSSGIEMQPCAGAPDDPPEIDR